MVAANSSASASLKEYLKRYENKADEDKKKKKKKKKGKSDAMGVVVVDEDPVWQKPVDLEDDADDSADDATPVIEEDIEVKRMKRLEQLKSRRPFGAISEDGSGWVSLPAPAKQLNNDDQNSDISPPRKRRIRNDTPSPSPEPERRNEVADLSPPRQWKRRHHTPSPEPDETMLGQKHLISDDYSDISPPRKRSARNGTPSQEANHRPRKASPHSDISPPRKRSARNGIPSQETNHSPRKASPDSDISPPRRRHHSQGKDSSLSDLPDISPPRRGQKRPASLKEPKTGLVTGQDIKEMNARVKKDDWMRFKEMDPSISGRGAEPVYRDKATGARISKDELIKATKKDEKPKEIKLEWGKGLAQKREAEARQLELEDEKDKPFARTRDDPELDSMLKERVRWGDPMAHLVKRKNLDPFLSDLGDNEKMKESGFVIPQDIPSHSWIKRGVEAAPNRYGIRPGRHWDGVDRSTGYEKQLFKRTNEKQATEKEAYLWSVADM